MFMSVQKLTEEKEHEVLLLNKAVIVRKVSADKASPRSNFVDNHYICWRT